MARQVAIVGAGITGMATAYYLEKQARESGRAVECTLIEAADRPGGKVVTGEERDFVIEGGPDSFVTDKPWALELCHDLGLADQLIPCNPHNNNVYLLKNGRLIAFPAGFRLTIPTRLKPFLLSPLISPSGKWRMAAEYFLPARPAPEDESVASFIGRRFGAEAVELFGGPMMAGIYVSDPDRLSMRATFPTFLEMERKHGSLIRAARAMKKHPPPRRAGPEAAGGAMFNSLRGGMGQLTEGLREKINAAWLFSTEVTALERKGGRWVVRLSGADGNKLEADDVVLALAANRAAALTAAIHPELAGQLRGLRFVSTATVSLAFLKEDLPSGFGTDGYGLLVPAFENRKMIAATWSSNKFKHRAPRDCALLRVFVGGYRNEALAELEEDALCAVVRREVKELFGIQAEPLLTRVFRWPKGNPQYDVGHLDWVAGLERLAADTPGLHLAGSSYHGVGLPDCIKSARRAAGNILPGG